MIKIIKPGKRQVVTCPMCKFNEVDLERNAPLRDTVDFNFYMLNIRLKELGDEFISSLRRILNEID